MTALARLLRPVRDACIFCLVCFPALFVLAGRGLEKIGEWLYRRMR